MPVAPRVLLSPVLLGIINAYQPGCYLDMRVFTSVANPLDNIGDILQPPSWWRNDDFLSFDPFSAFGPVVVAWYTERGYSRLTKLIACIPRMRDIVVAHAVFSGNLSVLARLPVEVVRAVEMALLDIAAFKGHLIVLKYLHADARHNGCTTWAVDAAAVQGHVDIVEYLLANRREGGSTHALNGASRNGHLAIVKLFHAHYTYQPHESFRVALEAAATHNHFDIVSYIVDLFGPAVRHSTSVLDGAASNGHLDMVQFLHERNFECTTNAMDWAAGDGHQDVVKWLHENRTEGCTELAMSSAAYLGHLEVVQWLHKHRQEDAMAMPWNTLL